VRCRNKPYIDQGGAAARHRVRRSPRRALPWGGPPGTPAPSQTSSISDQTSLCRHPILQEGSRLPRARFSQSQPPRQGRPAGVAGAIGFADPGRCTRLTGTGSYEEDGGRLGRAVVSTALNLGSSLADPFQ
jgi:hypothetical protein